MSCRANCGISTPQDEPRPWSKPIHLIAAVAKNGVIGLDGQLPWKIPQDWDWLLQNVSGGVLIEGRKCYEEVGSKFPGSAATIVLSRNRDLRYQDAQVAHSVVEAIELAHQNQADTIWIGGGHEVFSEAYALASKFYLTEIDADFEGDVKLPAGWEGHFPHLIASTPAVSNGVNLSFNVYSKLPI
eukprot:m.264876 g.264876  ORF g.264876 m.264876 type:complete len:185 (+) comp58703_c0_seq1:332-886(+)